MSGSRSRGTPQPSRGALATLLAILLALSNPTGASGQVLQGRVVDDRDERPVATALVRLLDPSGRDQAVAVADAAGRYRLEVPGTGEYYVVAERIGYNPFESHLLRMENDEATYPVDILMSRAPIAIEGFTITAERLAELNQILHREVGLSPSSLRFKPMLRPQIERHLVRGNSIVDLVRYSNVPSLFVIDTAEGTCFRYRGRHCVPVYINGWRLHREIVSAYPLDQMAAFVFVTPNESIKYVDGALLLYTEAWLR